MFSPNAPWVLIGGSGFLGTNLMHELASRGQSFVVIDRLAPRWGLPEGGQFFEADVREFGIYASHIQSGSVVVHLAANSFPGASERMLETEIQDDVLPLVRIANTCADIGASALLFCSSGGAIYGDQEMIPIHEECVLRPKSAHGVMKLTSEHYLRVISSMRHLPVALLRIANPFGLWHGGRKQGIVNVAMSSILKGEPIELYGDGLQARDYLFASDVSSAMYRVGTSFRGTCEAFNIGTGIPRTVDEVIESVFQVAGRRVEIIRRDARTVDVRANALNIQKMEQWFGWTPSCSFEDGLRETWNWACSAQDIYG